MRIYTPGERIRYDFNTVTLDGTALSALTGSPAAAVYDIAAPTTAITTGVTLTAGTAGNAGLNQVDINPTNFTTYPAGHYVVRLTAGTVDGVSVVGRVVFRFRVRETPGIIRRGIAGGVAAQALTMAGEAAPGADFFRGGFVRVVSATTGAGQIRAITASTNANPPVLTLDFPWSVTPTGTIEYEITAGTPFPSIADLQTGLATSAALTTVEGKVDVVDTVADAIKVKTDNLPTDPADQSLVIAATDAIIAAIAALNNLSAAAVNSEADTALSDWWGTSLGATYNNLTREQALKGVLVALGVVTGLTAGAGAGTLMRPDGTTPGSTATLDGAGNKSAVTFSL